MPIGNQNIWDKGIGAGATNVIFGQQPQQTNFNPGALGADPNARQQAQQQPVNDANILANSTQVMTNGTQEGWNAAWQNWNDPKNMAMRTGKRLVDGQWMTDEEYTAYLQEKMNSF